MRSLDLAGQKYGKLTVLNKTDKRKGTSVVWLCHCDCGNECEVTSYNLRTGQTKSCGCLVKESKKIVDLTGKRFGKLTVIEKTKSKYNKVTWKCKCDCGNITEVISDALKSGNTKSCGCLQTEDLSGQRFGRLVVLRKTEKRTKGGNIVWECKCDCGNTFEAINSKLKDTTQCSECTKKEKEQNICSEFIGKRYGKLLVLELSETSTPQKRMFKCQCDCGNIIDATLAYLKSGKKISCGCFRIERKIEDISGQRFGNLIVLEKTNKRAGGGSSNYIWKCRCDCGNVIGAAASDLKNGFTKCCGCTDPYSIVYDVTDLTGQRFGRLKVLGEVEQEAPSTSISNTIWRCQCDCGNIVELLYNNMKSGHTKSCGCLRKDMKKTSRN